MKESLRGNVITENTSQMKQIIEHQWEYHLTDLE